MTSIEQAVQVFAIIQFLVIGVSHVVQPRVWVRFFTVLREHERAGVFVVAFMSLWFGSIVVAFHNVWSGIPAVLTVIGWAQVLKGTIYFVFPAVGLRGLRLVREDRARRYFAPGGLLFIALAGLLAYHLLSLPPRV